MGRQKSSVSRIWERVRSTPGLGRDVTALLTVVLVGVIALTVIMANERYTPPWADRDMVSADFESAPAVVPSQRPKVRIAGVVVGETTDSQVTPAGKARLTFSMEPGHPIFDNARLVLRPINPVNEMYVEINPGGPPGKALPSGGVLPVSQTSRPIQPDEIFDHLDERTRTALSSMLATADTALANAPQQLPGGLNATDGALRQFKPVLDKLQRRRDDVRHLVTAISQIAGAAGSNDARLAQLANSTQQTIGVLSRNDANVRQALNQLPPTADGLRSAMGSVQDLAGELTPALDKLNSASGKLPDTLQKVSGVADNLRGTMQAARPVVSQAKPVVGDLRPLVSDTRHALGDLAPITRDLQPITATVVPYLNDLAAFFFNTSSVFSGADANGGYIRGHYTLPLPDGGVIPGTHGGNAFPDGGTRR